MLASARCSSASSRANESFDSHWASPADSTCWARSRSATGPTVTTPRATEPVPGDLAEALTRSCGGAGGEHRAPARPIADPSRPTPVACCGWRTSRCRRGADMSAERTRVVGYVPGVFDMFHIGHLNIVRRSRERCDWLIAGVVDDDAVEQMKGHRPIVPLG